MTYCYCAYFNLYLQFPKTALSPKEKGPGMQGIISSDEVSTRLLQYIFKVKLFFKNKIPHPNQPITE